MTQTIDLPLKFWIDREERSSGELPMPTVIKSLSRSYRVAADDPALGDFLSDAEYYSDIVSMSGDFAYAGLQASARATVKAIRAARK